MSYNLKQKEYKMKLAFRGRTFATPTAMTLVVDGNEIFSGIVGADQALDSEFSMVELDNVAANVTLPASLSVTSGVLTCGSVWMIDENGEAVSTDLRVNELINGVAPEWPATPVVPMPGGTTQAPDWNNWFFELSAGETITFNLVTTE
jgi:hypothetical protein